MSHAPLASGSGGHCVSRYARLAVRKGPREAKHKKSFQIADPNRQVDVVPMARVVKCEHSGRERAFACRMAAQSAQNVWQRFSLSLAFESRYRSQRKNYAVVSCHACCLHLLIVGFIAARAHVVFLKKCRRATPNKLPQAPCRIRGFSYANPRAVHLTYRVYGAVSDRCRFCRSWLLRR